MQRRMTIYGLLAALGLGLVAVVAPASARMPYRDRGMRYGTSMRDHHYGMRMGEHRYLHGRRPFRHHRREARAFEHGRRYALGHHHGRRYAFGHHHGRRFASGHGERYER